MFKFLSIMLMLLMTSGCCEVFGICTSAGVNVHTSATSPDKFASSSLHDGFDASASATAPALAQASVRPASTMTTSPHYLFPY
jgi:hypothetical protein